MDMVIVEKEKSFGIGRSQRLHIYYTAYRRMYKARANAYALCKL
jgi:hypothetical protein